jgi:hypothetical protein
MALRIRRNHSAGGVTYRTVAVGAVAGSVLVLVLAVRAGLAMKVASRWQRQQVSLNALSSQ